MYIQWAIHLQGGGFRPGRVLAGAGRQKESCIWGLTSGSVGPILVSVGGNNATDETANGIERSTQMAKDAKKEPATKVVTLASVEAGIAELVKDGIVGENVSTLIEQGIVKAELDVVEVEAGKFSGDYVRFSIGEKAKTDKQVIAALVAISGGNLTAPAKTGDDAEEGETDDRKPSLVKFALYGADLNARSRTSQRVKSAAEGPEKAIEKMADQIQKAKPGKFTREQAVQMATMLLADDTDDEQPTE